MENYFVIENRNVGTAGNPVFVETILFSGTKEECVAFWDTQRKGYGDNREVVDCFVKSETEVNNLSVVDDFWNSLAEEDKKETIVVDGKKYNKALYNFHNRNK